MIDDGRMIDFLLDAWLSNLFLSRWLTFISSEAREAIYIYDLIQAKERG